ncbi:extracellular solute-binding protein [Proteinivorax tanatarense]|uniref:Extracellular solute-binding protein n=1 Tax=Proteinivorax tanatarense TaxID=1260629 RepID=A0AAU7VJF0_9FIRM
MKKSFSLLLIVLLALPLAACGGDGGEEVGVAEGLDATISVQVEEEWLDYYEGARERVLERNPDSEIEWIVTGSFDHLDVLDSTDATNTDVADVFAIPADRIYGLNTNNAIAPIDALTMAENVGGFGDYDAGLGGNFQIDGEYLAFPMNIETLINFGNKANAEAAGIDLDDTIEFTELEHEDMLVPAFDAWFGVALTNSADIELLGQDDSGNLYSDLTADFDELTQDQQEFFTALFDYWKSHNEAGTSMWDEDDAWGYMDNQFTSGGNTSIRLEGPWSTNNLSEQANDGEDLAIFPMNQVTINGNPLAHWQGGWGMVANARIEVEEEKMLLAQAFMEEIVNPDYAVEFFAETGKIMENVEASVFMDSDLSETDKEVIEAVISSYDEAPARPLFTEWGQVWDTWKNGLLSWDNVEPETAEEAYEQIKSSFEAMMASF